MKIFLVGMMGSGKSYWSKKLAEQMDLLRIELDDEIEKSEHASISRIFEEKGEHYFRVQESGLLKRYALFDDFVMSCGGGTACFFNNMDWMNRNGVTIWINPPEATIVKQIMPGILQRPLLAGMDGKAVAEFVAKKLEERKPYYEKADIICRESVINLDELQIQIINKYKEKFNDDEPISH